MPPKSSRQKPRSLKPAKEGYANLREPDPRHRRKSGRVSAACEACKTRKTKCSGHPPPCTMCEQLNTLCVIDLTLDMRRRTALQRTLEESRNLQNALKYTVEVLRRGERTEMQDLVLHLQGSELDEVAEKLNVRYDDISHMHIQPSNYQMEGEQEQSSNLASEAADTTLREDQDESENSDRSMDISESSRRRPFDSSLFDTSRSSGKSSQHEIAQGYDFEFLSSAYLPLITMLRSVSNTEATRMLHDFRTSPGSTGTAALYPWDDRQSQQNLSLQTNQHPQTATKSEISSPDRSNWHPSLQLTSSKFRRPIVQSTSQSPWNDRRSVNCPTTSFSKGDAHLEDMAKPSTEKAAAEAAKEAEEAVAEEAAAKIAGRSVQVHPAIYSAMPVKKASAVVEVFGDLKALEGNEPRRTSLQEIVVQSSATIPMHLIQSRLVLEESPLSKVFTGFRDGARQMIATGTPVLEIIGGGDVVVDLFFRERQPTDTFTCASWACELWRSFRELPNTVRIACIFLLTRLMRWMVFPTPETYAEVPEYQRPTPIQCHIAHIPATDLHPIPAFRDMLCDRPQDWVTPLLSTGISCNWPFKEEDALVKDPASGSIKISKLFMDHVADYENWSFISVALSLYPQLEGRVRIVDS